MKEYLAHIVETHPGRDATNVMREYLQARILESLQVQGAWRSIAFMGGTALRFLYHLPRYSEDLDFSLEAPDQGFDLRTQMQATCARLEHEGYDVRARVATKVAVHKAFVSFPGLEHQMGLSTRTDKAFSIKVEVDTRPPEGAKLETTTVRRYATLRLTHHDKASLVAGKVAALICREWLKGRDVYDLVWYLSDPAWLNRTSCSCPMRSCSSGMRTFCKGLAGGARRSRRGYGKRRGTMSCGMPTGSLSGRRIRGCSNGIRCCP